MLNLLKRKLYTNVIAKKRETGNFEYILSIYIYTTVSESPRPTKVSPRQEDLQDSQSKPHDMNDCSK